jgi:hypothetical protein
MELTELFLIDGKPLPVPDRDITMSFEDLDAPQAGRDEAGFMHRMPVRRKVGVWKFQYSHLTGETYRYLQSILPAGGSFRFTCPEGETEAYLSRYSIIWRNARTDTYRDLQFSIIEC